MLSKECKGSGEQIRIDQLSFKYAWTFLNRWKLFRMFDNCTTKEVFEYKWDLPSWKFKDAETKTNSGDKY